MTGCQLQKKFSGVAVVVVDDHERPVLLADATSEAYAADGARLEFDRQRREVAYGAPYGVLVSPERVRLFNGAGIEPIAEFPTASILGPYTPGASLTYASPRFLVCLAEAWLSDVAYGWSGKDVPACELLEQIGLADKLRAGTSHVAPDERGGLRP